MLPLAKVTFKANIVLFFSQDKSVSSIEGLVSKSLFGINPSIGVNVIFKLLSVILVNIGCGIRKLSKSV